MIPDVLTEVGAAADRARTLIDQISPLNHLDTPDANGVTAALDQTAARIGELQAEVVDRLAAIGIAAADIAQTMIEVDERMADDLRGRG